MPGGCAGYRLSDTETWPLGHDCPHRKAHGHNECRALLAFSGTGRRDSIVRKSAASNSGKHKVGDMSRLMRTRKTYLCVIVVALVVAATIVVARTLGTIDSYDGI